VTLGAEEIRRAIGQSKVSQDRTIGIARKTDLADQAPSSRIADRLLIRLRKQSILI
jgi:hypothetical protein